MIEFCCRNFKNTMEQLQRRLKESNLVSAGGDMRADPGRCPECSGLPAVGCPSCPPGSLIHHTGDRSHAQLLYNEAYRVFTTLFDGHNIDGARYVRSNHTHSYCYLGNSVMPTLHNDYGTYFISVQRCWDYSAYCFTHWSSAVCLFSRGTAKG